MRQNFTFISRRSIFAAIKFRQDSIAAKLHTAKFRTVKFQSKFYGEISALCVSKITIQPVQSHDKIAVKFYAERANAKSINFALKNPYGKISPSKARPKPVQSPPKECKKTKSCHKILVLKFRPQISPSKIVLDMGRDLNSRQISRAKFYAKIHIKLAKFIVNSSERFSRFMKFPARSPFLARSV